jgi:hypothetical protein
VRAPPTALSSRQPCVVIADDSTVAREGLVAIIRRDLGYTVCGLAIDERATRELTEKHRPDLLVIEPFLGHHDGIFLLKQLAARFLRALRCCYGDVRIIAYKRIEKMSSRVRLYRHKLLAHADKVECLKANTKLGKNITIKFIRQLLKQIADFLNTFDCEFTTIRNDYADLVRSHRDVTKDFIAYLRKNVVKGG